MVVVKRCINLVSVGAFDIFEQERVEELWAFLGGDLWGFLCFLVVGLTVVLWPCRVCLL